MRKNIYTIWDRVAKEMGPLFEAKNHEVARRSVLKQIEKVAEWDKSSYVLVCVGTLETEFTDSIVGKSKPEAVDLDIPSMDEVEEQESI